MRFAKKPALRTAGILLVLLAVFTLAIAAFADEAAEKKVVFVSASRGSDGGDGSRNAPFETLARAIDEICYTGGTVVLTDRYVLDAGREVVDSIPRYNAPTNYKPITITSVYGGRDYRESGASLHFPDKSAYLLGGATTFAAVTVTSDAEDAYIAGCFRELTFGEGFEAVCKKGDTTKFLYAIGGYFAPATRDLPADKNAHITIDAGTFKKVIGFTHVKGIATYTFTGTSYITVNGGTIGELYGASNYNHYSGSTEITVNDGQITKLYAGGDGTRRLNGKAEIYLNGGAIGQVFLNNVMGNVDVLLDAAVVRKMGVSYGSDALEQAAYISVISLRYNSVIHASSEIGEFKGFSQIKNYGNVYVAEGGTGDGESAAAPTGDLNAAIAVIADGGGSVVILGEYRLGDFTEMPRTGRLTITGTHGDRTDGKLILAGRYTASGETVFENIAIEGAENARINGGGNRLCIGDGVHTTGLISLCGLDADADLHTGNDVDIMIRSGSFDGVAGFGGQGMTFGNAKVKIYGGNIGMVAGLADGGTCGSVFVAVSDGEIGKITSAAAGSAAVTNMTAEISGGTVGEIAVSGVSGRLLLRYAGGNIGAARVTGKPQIAQLKYNEIHIDAQTAEQFAAAFDSCEGEKVVFVADGGDGNGLSAEMPIGTLDKAANLLKNTGGDIVIVGRLTLSSGVLLPAINGSVTLSGRHDGTDYAENGAMLILGGGIAFSCDATVEYIAIETAGDDVNLVFNGFKGHIGEGIVSTRASHVEKYTNLVAGSNSGEALPTDLTVDSGTWNELLGGHSISEIYNRIAYSVTVNGGTFLGKATACGKGMQSGTATLTINGGTFYSGVYGTGTFGAEERFKGTLTINIGGGTFYGKIAPGVRRTSEINGSYNVIVTGGDFSHLTDIIGNELYAGNAESTITVAADYNAFLKPSGSFTWTNPLRRMADPRIILVDGLYYYVYTTGSVLSVYKAANIPDLAYSVGEPVWDARKVSEALEGRDEYIWPSKLMYYSPEEFGEDAGWYLLFTTYKPHEDEHGNTQGDDRRSYILKAASSDLQGDWVNPETGEKNIPARFGSDTYDWVNNTDWTAGQTTFRHGGKNYCLWIEQRGRGTAEFAQRVYLAEMKNPWTVTGEILELIVPEYDWEREGYGYSSSQQQWYPAVIEGLTPVHNADGDLFVVYAGSGYWTPGYCLGQMTFKGGDILDIANWEKSPTPVFKKNGEVCGVGGPSIITSPDGEDNYLLYHAYLGQDTSGPRYCFMEPYYVDETGFHVGKDHSPSPLATEFSIEVNSMPVADKISGFKAVEGIDESRRDAVPTTARTQNTTVLIVEILCVLVVIASAVVVIVVQRKKPDSK